jgi:hypothetical protein
MMMMMIMIMIMIMMCVTLRITGFWTLFIVLYSKEHNV